MATRKGMMKGKGRGYHNVIGKDPMVHSQSAKGIKQPQRVNPRFEPTPIKYKKYKCSRCGFVKEIDTNHYGQCYSLGHYNTCPNCPPYAKYPEFGGSTTWDCVEKPPKPENVPERWKKVKIGDVVHERVVEIKPFRRWEHFQNKENRDKRFKELVAKHGNIFRRTSSRGQVLHPEYVKDYEGKVQTGIGNTMYKTMFPVLYDIEFKHGYDAGDLK